MSMAMALSPVGNQEPVTALCFADNILYVGAGSFLKVFDWAGGSLLSQRQVFEINKLHGITCYNDTQLVLWGGDSYAVVQKNAANDIDIVVSEQRCKDWIVDIKVGEPSGAHKDPVMFIQTAHNEVLEVVEKGGSVNKVHKCDERSILYCGKLFITNTCRLAAAGTVFGGVVVWDIDTDSILHTFTEHEGSIFDVAWSPDGSYLASCSDDRAIIVWDLSQNRSVAQGWGHISRIWRLVFASNRKVISTAEDCTARVWEISDCDSRLNCSSIFTGHKGRNIWSCALSDEGTVIATGGGDGRVMLWDLSNTEERLASREHVWDMHSEFGGQVRDCAVNSVGTTAVTTVDGKVWLWHGHGDWVPQAVNLSRMPLIKAFDTVFVAVTLAGQVTALEDNGEVQASGQLGVGILSFHILSKCLIVVQTTPPYAGYRLYDVSTQKCLTELEKPMDQSIMTCAALSSDESMLCIGTRKGGLALYDLSNQSGHLVSFEPNALGCNDAVTAVKFAAEPFVTATSRSTEYGNFSVPGLAPLLKNRARRRGSVEGFADTVNGLVFWGFQNESFNAWNASLEFEISSTSCGGSHRAWGFSMLNNDKDFTLCYVRSPRFVVHTNRIQSAKFKYPMLQPGTHGREIRGLEACPTNSRLVAMGSEDTFVSIGWINGARIENATMIRNGHISGIQSLHWDPMGRFLFTGAGQGELVMWEVKTVGKAIFAHEVSRMPSAPGSDIYDLRVMDFSILGDLIAVAYSDSSFRVWQFGKEWNLLLRQKYRECCLLKINLVEVEGQVILFIFSTDGHLVIYNLADENASHAEIILRYKLHQSGIRDSVLLSRDSRKYQLFSGGDDNALRGVELTFENTRVHVDELFTVLDAHSSSVTAVCINTDKDKILSTSADQKVKVWTLSGDLLATRFTDISDTGVIMENKGQVIAGGLGLEFFELH